MRPTPYIACAFLALAGCHRDDADELGMKVQKTEAVALDKLTDPDVLVMAMQQPGETLDGRLGPRGLDVTTTTLLEYKGARDRVEERLALDLDGKGGFHLVHDLDHPEKLGQTVPKGDSESGPREQVPVATQGMEAVAVEGQLYVRPRYGKFIVRRPEAGERDRLRELCELRFGDDLELLRPFLAISDAGSGNVLGHPTKKLGLALAASPRTPKAAGKQQVWREQMKVTKLDGTLEVDAATGAPLAGKLEADFSVPRDQGALGTHLSITLASRAASAITAPEAVPAPKRPRPMVERNQLLEGLAAPSGTSAARTPQ